MSLVSSSVLKTKEDLAEAIYKDVLSWYEGTNEALKLRILSQRYNKTCARFGLRVIDAVVSDPRLECKMARSGSRFVAPRALVAEHFGELSYNFWKSHGVPVGS